MQTGITSGRHSPAHIRAGQRLSGVLFYALIAIILWSPLPFGSNSPVFWSIFNLLIFVLGACWFAAAALGRIDTSALAHKALRLPLICMVGICTWLTVQAMYAGVTQPTAFQTSYNPEFSYGISVNTTATVDALKKSAAYATLFVLVPGLATTTVRIRQLAMAIVIMGALQACYGSLMVLSGAELSFFAEKYTYIGNATGTFINRNHLAGYLELAGGLAIGLLVAGLRQQAARNWRESARNLLETILGRKFLVRLMLAVIVIGLVMTHSRTGNVAFFSAMSLGALLFLVRNAGKKGEKTRAKSALILFSSLLVIDLAIVGNFFGVEKVVERLEHTSLEREQRDDVVRDTMPMLREHWLTGSGAGTFSEVFPRFATENYSKLYDQAHNDYVQFAVEFGLPGMLILGSLVLYCLWQAIAAALVRKDALMKGMGLGCAIAIVSLLIHTASDFNLQVPSNAALFVVILALACQVRHLR